MKTALFILCFLMLSCQNILRMPDDFDIMVNYNSGDKWATADSSYVQKGGGKTIISITKAERQKIWDSLNQHDFLAIPQNFECKSINSSSETTKLTIFHAKKVVVLTDLSSCMAKEKKEQQALRNILADINKILARKRQVVAQKNNPFFKQNK